jgi:DNA repair protein RadA/Sms
MDELDRVLGGGLVPGSVVLVAGEPGIGKSTLMLMLAAGLRGEAGDALYVAGEESQEQTKLRADRLGLQGPQLLVLAETDLSAILAEIEARQPSLVVVDSIQSVYEPGLESIPGMVSQVRQAGARLTEWAKRTGAALFLVGHVTKSGAVAGPRIIEHMVDTVIYFEGDSRGHLRLLRATKNRFGSTDELGVFEMTGAGLQEVANPSEVFLAQRPLEASGSAVACTMEGTRPLLVEVQALLAPSYFGTPQRSVNCLDRARAALILAVLEKRGGLALADHDVFLNIAGGIRVTEPASDLAVALAIVSSFRDRPVPADLVACGELGLSGEIRTPPRLARRLAEAQRLGFRRFLTRSAASEKSAAGDSLTLVETSSIAEALDVI